MTDDDDLIRLLSAGPAPVEPSPDAIRTILAGATTRRRRRQRGVALGGMAAVVVAVTVISLAVAGLAHRSSGTPTGPAARTTAESSPTVSHSSVPAASRSTSAAGTSPVAQPPAPAPSSSSPSATRTAISTTTTTTTPSAAPVASSQATRPMAFHSPSGNIDCSSPDAGIRVICRIGTINGASAPRPGDCAASDWGHTVMVDEAHGGRLVCDTQVSVDGSGPVLEYDTGERLGAVDCQSRSTCTVDSGAGFHLTSAAIDLIPASGSSDHPTTVVADRYFDGNTLDSRYRPGTTISTDCDASRASTRTDARSCEVVGSKSLDPCFLSADSKTAACPTDLTSNVVTVVDVTSSIASQTGVTAAAAWAIELADGTTCRAAPDTWLTLADGHAASYQCSNGRYVVGSLDHSSSTWSVQLDQVGVDIRTVAVTVAHQ